tara:strand:- start:60 stop:827 length:768 start_codon:yes stop_codon:yes gene_type:complete
MGSGILSKESIDLIKNTQGSVVQLGPIISIYTLPKDVFTKLNEIVDKVIKEGGETKGSQLAGRIKEEYAIDPELLNNEDIYNYFNFIVYCYIRDCCLAMGFDERNAFYSKINIGEIWVNKMVQHEYNPIHWHDYKTTVSAVLYLKVPEMSQEKIDGKHQELAGQLTVVNKSASINSLEIPLINLMPIEGQIVLFPAHLLHTVHPFDNDVERISLAFNATHKFRSGSKEELKPRGKKSGKLGKNIIKRRNYHGKNK